MNMASTRSHCIFTIHISSRDVGSHTIRKAKLHLVDLAGYIIYITSYVSIVCHSLSFVALNVFLSQVSVVLFSLKLSTLIYHYTISNRLLNAK